MVHGPLKIGRSKVERQIEHRALAFEELADLYGRNLVGFVTRQDLELGRMPAMPPHQATAALTGQRNVGETRVRGCEREITDWRLD